VNHHYALRYAAAGMRVHPLYEVDPSTQTCACYRGAECPEKFRGKHPRLSGWQDKATTDEATIREWWSRHPRAGVGIATGEASRVWVLDIDGHEAMAWYDAQLVAHGMAPTLGVRTSRGAHLYWRWADGVMVRNAQGIAPGVDVRGEGGYVCAPPTVHRSGHVYTWVIEDGWARTPTDPPAWLLELVRERPRPPTPKPVAIPRRTAWTRAAADRELARVLRLDPSARTLLGQQLDGDVTQLHVRHVKCPQCGKASVWWTIAGPGHAKCSHLNSCGWHAPLVSLLA
jgi:putative DNA primase/helicase